MSNALAWTASDPAVLHGVFEMKGECIAVVTINRPKQMNALNTEVCVRLAELFTKLNSHDSCRVVILTGAGDEVFSAGADLKRLNHSDQRGSQA